MLCALCNQLNRHTIDLLNYMTHPLDNWHDETGKGPHLLYNWHDELYDGNLA